MFCLWDHTNVYKFKMQTCTMPGLCCECLGKVFLFPSPRANAETEESRVSWIFSFLFSLLLSSSLLYLSGALADYLSSQVWKWEIQRTNSQFTGRFPQNKLCLQGAYLFSRFLLLFSFWIPRIFLILTSRPVPSSRLSLEARKGCFRRRAEGLTAQITSSSFGRQRNPPDRWPHCCLSENS